MHMKNLPQWANLSQIRKKIEIRGEVYMQKLDFEKFNKKLENLRKSMANAAINEDTRKQLEIEGLMDKVLDEIQEINSQ